MQMAGAYAAFGNKGIYNKPHTVTKIVLSDGQTEIDTEPQSTVAMKESTAYMVSDVLKMFFLSEQVHQQPYQAYLLLVKQVQRIFHLNSLRSTTTLVVLPVTHGSLDIQPIIRLLYGPAMMTRKICFSK